ncbi:hypothetical protein ES705_27252 [subsurface metagenome]
MLNKLVDWGDIYDIINLRHPGLLAVFHELHIQVIVGAGANIGCNGDVNACRHGGKLQGLGELNTLLTGKAFYKATLIQQLLARNAAPAYGAKESNRLSQPSVVEADIYLEGIAIGELNLLPSDNPNSSYTRSDDFHTGNIHRYSPSGL